MTTDERNDLEEDFDLLEDKFDELIELAEKFAEYDGLAEELLLAFTKAAGGTYTVTTLNGSKKVHGHNLADLRAKLFGSLSRVA